MMRMMAMRMAQDDDNCDGDDLERLPVGQECHEAPCKHSKKSVHCADAMSMKLAAARLHHPSKEMLGVHDISHCMDGAPRFFYYLMKITWCKMEGAPRDSMQHMILGHDHTIRVHLGHNALGPVLCCLS